MYSVLDDMPQQQTSLTKELTADYKRGQTKTR